MDPVKKKRGENWSTEEKVSPSLFTYLTQIIICQFTLINTFIVILGNITSTYRPVSENT